MAAPKFGRNFKLLVQVDQLDSLATTGTSAQYIRIEPPFTIEFDITRKILGSANVGQIRIYNLSAANRNLLRYDFSNISDVRTVSLAAGYGQNLPVIFTGNITQAWSVREGVNFITTIEVFDGGTAFLNGNVPDGGGTFPAGTAMLTIYKTLIGYLPGVSLGAIAPWFTQDALGNLITISRAKSYSGSVTDILTEISGKAFFIDNGRAYVLRNNDVLEGQVALVNADSGLLGTPLREQQIVTFDMVFEPGLIVAQQLQLQSLTAPQLNSFGAPFNPATGASTETNVNGLYRVTGIKHRGMISESVCGDAVTSVELFFGSEALNLVTYQ